MAQDPYLHIWQCAGVIKRKNCIEKPMYKRRIHETAPGSSTSVWHCLLSSYLLEYQIFLIFFFFFYHSGITTEVLRGWNVSETSKTWFISEIFVKVKYWPLLLDPKIIIQSILKSGPDKIVSPACFRAHGWAQHTKLEKQEKMKRNIWWKITETLKSSGWKGPLTVT